jgi:2'-5' RNA ligase
MRTFIALNLPANERYVLEQALAPARQHGLPVRWTEPNGLHLTLKFLGEIDDSQVQPVADALQQVSARNDWLTLRIAGFGAFPSLRRASVLWVGVTADPRLLALQRDLEETLAPLGYASEERAFRPHLTVARTQRGARAPDVSRLADEFDYDRKVAVHTVDLMLSRPGPSGSRYEALVQTTLGKGGP